MYEIGPLVDISRPNYTRPCIYFYKTGWQQIRLYIDVGQRSTQGLLRFKFCRKSILFLSQHQTSSPLDCVAFLETSAGLKLFSVFIEIHLAITVPPSHADMMPFAIIS